jgi:O-antigen/teichoic acid export membrane protein
MYEKFKQLGQESVIYGIGGVVSKFIGFLLLPIYTRVFAPADYGVMDVIATMTGLAAIILTAGSESALSYYFFVLRAPAEQRKTITSTGFYLFAVNLLVALLGWFTAEQIATLTFGNGADGRYLRVAVLSIPFSSLAALNLDILRLQRKPWLYLALSLSQLLFTVLSNICLVVYLRVGIIGVFWTNLVSAVLFCALGLAVNRQYFGLRFDVQRLGQILRYGLPLVVSGLSMWSINFLDRYFLLHYASLEEIGLYSVGLKLAALVGFVTQAFRTANAPFQFEVASDADARRIYAYTLRYYLLVTALLCVPLTLFAQPILRLLTTAHYLAAHQVVGLAAYAAVGYGLYQIIGVGLMITKRTNEVGMAVVVGGLLNVSYLWLLTPGWGMIGAIVATVLAHLTIVVLLYWRAQRAYAIPFDLGYATRLLALVAVILTLHAMLPLATLWSSSIVAIGLWGLFLWIVWRFGFVDARELVRMQAFWEQQGQQLKAIFF